MTDEERGKCHLIIHTAAVAAGAGNVVPIPGLGAGADMAAMTTMAVSLASVFGREFTGAMARGLAYSALKKTICKQPRKFLGKELAKCVPFVGQAISVGLSIALTEAAGWQLAQEFDLERRGHLALAY